MNARFVTAQELISIPFAQIPSTYHHPVYVKAWADGTMVAVSTSLGHMVRVPHHYRVKVFT